MFLCLLLLVAICVSSNFDHAKYWSKQKYLLPLHSINNKLKETDINYKI